MPRLPDIELDEKNSIQNSHHASNQSKSAQNKRHNASMSTPVSPHLPLVISSFTRPARPPSILNPRRLTIYTQAGSPQVLGRGTFGVVYPGMLDAVCPVAVKHLRPRPLRSNSIPVSRESARDAASRHARLAKLQFRREIRRYAALRTVPGVVRFYGLIGKDMFVIERLFGGALNSVVRRPENDSLLAPRCVLRLASMLANAVADLHRRGMSHGDLKPSNVLLSEPLSRFGGVVTDAVHVKLVDFGLSRRFQPLDDDDDDDDDVVDDDYDDIDFERASASSSKTFNKVTQSVQLAARRYSCPISRPPQLENSDSELSDDDDQLSNKAQSNRIEENDVTEGEEDHEDDENDDDTPVAPHPLAAFPKDARGTPAYLSPEGWCGPAALSHRQVALKSDVYALAMILYELETGVVPWHSMSEWAIFVAVSNNAQRPLWPEERERVSGLRNIVEDCWAQNYRDRPTCRQLAHRIQSLLHNLGANVQATCINKDGVSLTDANNEANEININQTTCSETLQHASEPRQLDHVKQRLINKVEYTTPPASTNSLISGQTLSESPSIYISKHHPNFSDSITPASPTYPNPHIALTPPSSPARTSSHPSPGMHAVRSANHGHNQPLPVQQVQPSNFSIPTQNSFEQRSHTSNGYEPDSHENTIQSPTTTGHGSDGYHTDSMHSPGFHGSQLTPLTMDAQTAAQKYLNSPSPNPNHTTSARSPHAEPKLHSQPSTNGSLPVSARSLEYPYKDLVMKDGCSSLCNLVAQHERNPKEATAVLEALGVLLDDSQPNCLTVANGGTLIRLAAILSRYGPNDSRLCKSVCGIIFRLAVSQNAEIEMKLRVCGACDMVLNCMRWHVADLPVIQNGVCTLNALCRLSPEQCSIFVSQGGPATALRALARAVKTFNRDVLVATVALEVLSATARDNSHAFLSNGILADMFSYCDAFGHCRIDERFIVVIHAVLKRLPESRDKIVCIPNCVGVLSRLLDRTRGTTNWVSILRYACEVVSELVISGMREATAAMLGTSIVEDIVESLDKLCDTEGASDVAAGASGLSSLYYLSGLGGDVYGSFQMSNVFDMTRKLVAWAPNNRAVASHAASLVLNVLRQMRQGHSLIANTDVVYDMLAEMREKWRHDTTIVENVGQAMSLIRETAPTTERARVRKPKAEGRTGRPAADVNTPHVQPTTHWTGKIFGKRKGQKGRNGAGPPKS